MVFAWDEAKNRVNRRKHGISFELAVRVFEDPSAVSYVERVVDGQERGIQSAWLVALLFCR